MRTSALSYAKVSTVPISKAKIWLERTYNSSSFRLGKSSIRIERFHLLNPIILNISSTNNLLLLSETITAIFRHLVVVVDVASNTRDAMWVYWLGEKEIPNTHLQKSWGAHHPNMHPGISKEWIQIIALASQIRRLLPRFVIPGAPHLH